MDTTEHADVIGQSKNVLETILERAGMVTEVEARQEQDQIILDIRGEDAQSLVGRKGQVLDALQLLVGKIVNRAVGSGIPLLVDAEGYRDRRADSLVKLAHRLKDEAITSKKIVALNPMSPRDRRIIHLTLKDIPGVSTHSEGEGEDRRLLIVPE